MSIKKLLYILIALPMAVQGTDEIIDSVQNTSVSKTDEGRVIVTSTGAIIEGSTSFTAPAIALSNDATGAENNGEISTKTNSIVGIKSTSINNVKIINNGSISTESLGSHGIYNLLSDNSKITNNGSILTKGSGALCIYNYSSNNAQITNNGSISTEEQLSHGIYNVLSDNAQINNNGSISTKGKYARGIDNSSSNNAQITNNGSISTNWSTTLGIYNHSSDNTRITNNGSISTKEKYARGIHNYLSSNSQINNNGSISTEEQGSHAIHNLLSDSVVIKNSGTIVAKGLDALGIYISNSDNNIITNSGTIRSEQYYALYLHGSNPTLNILHGSVIDGPIYVSDPLNLSVQKNMNLVLTLDSIGAGFGSLDIDSPYVVSDSSIMIIDPTGFAMQADIVADLSDTVLGEIYHHRFDCYDPCARGFWAQGLGSYRHRKSHNDFHSWQGGFLVGYDSSLFGGYGALFGGVSFGKANIHKGEQLARTKNYIAGLSYEKTICNTFFAMAAIAGYVDWENERYVSNNLAKDGIEKITTHPDGLFFSPEVMIAHRFSQCNWSPELSLNIRYAGLYLGDYHEKKHLSYTSGALSVKNRNVELFTARLEASLPFNKCMRGCNWIMRPYIGLLTRHQVGGDHVKGKWLDKRFHFDQKGPRDLQALLFGFLGEQCWGLGHSFLKIEGNYDNEKSYRVIAEGGINWDF